MNRLKGFDVAWSVEDLDNPTGEPLSQYWTSVEDDQVALLDSLWGEMTGDM